MGRAARRSSRSSSSRRSGEHRQLVQLGVRRRSCSTNRIGFELHNAEFERLGLELTDTELEDVRTSLFEDPAPRRPCSTSSATYGDQLVEDVARQFKLQTELADEYAAWAAEAYPAADIEVSPRYGTWDLATGLVRPARGAGRRPERRPARRALTR